MRSKAQEDYTSARVSLCSVFGIKRHTWRPYGLTTTKRGAFGSSAHGSFPAGVRDPQNFEEEFHRHTATVDGLKAVDPLSAQPLAVAVCQPGTGGAG
jgi:hypothetical protein